MSVYDIYGNELSTVYDINGNSLTAVYDINGDEIFDGGDTPVETDTLTVMSFNVGHFYSEYYDAPSEAGQDFYDRADIIFGKYHSDVAGLQEYATSIGDIPSSTLMDKYFVDYRVSENSSGARSLASTYEISDYALVAYATQNGGTRYYQKGYITVGNKRICIISTHLALPSNGISVQIEQINELLQVVAREDYFILTGDFNSYITSASSEAYTTMVKPFIDAGYNSAINAENVPMTWFNASTVGGATKKYALDHIITSPNITINSVILDDTKLTDGLCTKYGVIIDHLPVVAQVTIH